MDGVVALKICDLADKYGMVMIDEVMPQVL
jgi:hypothetical protein